MEINWKLLDTGRAMSDASKVPASIDLLFSSDAAIRKQGYWQLDNHIVIQSDLESSAPYAARTIVDRFLTEQIASPELLDILVELALGSNSEILTIGPLAGEPIEKLCRNIVLETLPLLKELRTKPDCECSASINDLLENLQNI